MSLARVYTAQKVRKDWTCGKCRRPIRKGVDGRISFAVGFHGYEQTRCTRPECQPTRSELESSAVATVYAAIDGADLDVAATSEELQSIRDDIVAACEEVADEYESNEMYEINYDLQERAEMIRSAGDELSNWTPEEDEPVEEDYVDEECSECGGSGTTENDEADCDECGGTGYIGEQTEPFEDAHDEWLTNARESLREAIDGMELP